MGFPLTVKRKNLRPLKSLMAAVMQCPDYTDFSDRSFLVLGIFPFFAMNLTMYYFTRTLAYSQRCQESISPDSWNTVYCFNVTSHEHPKEICCEVVQEKLFSLSAFVAIVAGNLATAYSICKLLLQSDFKSNSESQKDKGKNVEVLQAEVTRNLTKGSKSLNLKEAKEDFSKNFTTGFWRSAKRKFNPMGKKVKMDSQAEEPKYDDIMYAGQASEKKLSTDLSSRKLTPTEDKWEAPPLPPQCVPDELRLEVREGDAERWATRRDDGLNQCLST